MIKSFISRFDFGQYNSRHQDCDYDYQINNYLKAFCSGEQLYNTYNPHDVFECFRVGPIFFLKFRKDEGRDDDDSHLGELGWLELDAEESHPTGCAIDSVASDNPHSHYEEQEDT